MGCTLREIRKHAAELFILVLHHVNPLNAELNPICHLLALVGAQHILHVSRVGLNSLQAEIQDAVQPSQV